jgi:hypothetical protein
MTIGSDTYDVRVYINGVRYYESNQFTASLAGNSLIINFNSVALGFEVTSSDDVSITGKFIDL